MAGIIPDIALTPEQAQEDISYELITTIIIAIVLETVAVVMRTISRRIQNTRWMWGDVLIAITYVMNIGLIIGCILAVKLGDVGKHIEVVPFDKIKQFLLITHYPLPVLYAFVSSLPKLAILEIFIRFFVLDPIPRYVSYFTGIIIILNALVNVPIVLLACQPISYTWGGAPEGHCLDTQALYLWATLPNIVTDGIMLVLPLPTVWRLQSTRRVKYGILTTFLVGSIGLIFSIVRFLAFDHPWTDGTYIAVPTLAATVAEPGAYLLAACFLTFRPLFRYIARDSFLSPVFSGLSSAASAVMSSVSAGGKRGGSVDDSIRGPKFANIRFSTSTNGSWATSTRHLTSQAGAGPNADDDETDMHVLTRHGTLSSELDIESQRPVSVRDGWDGRALAPMSPPEHDARGKDDEGHRAMSVGTIPSLRGFEMLPPPKGLRRVSVAV